MSEIDVQRLQALEAILFLAEEPVPANALSMALEAGTSQVTALLEELDRRLGERESGLVLRNVAGGWRLYAGEGGHEYVERHVLAGKSGRLSQAALETLAVIAYKQPISRSEVGDIRGVNAEGAVRSLVARGLVEEVGRDDGPGQAVLYGTTVQFLEKVGLPTLDDLPPLTDFLDDSAPDEPAPDQFREARRRLQAGGTLPTTGRPHWDAEDAEPEDAEPDDADERDGTERAPDEAPTSDDTRADLARKRLADVTRRREQEAEMDELTDALERVARSAMDQLRQVVAAAESDDEDDAGAPAAAPSTAADEVTP